MFQVRTQNGTPGIPSQTSTRTLSKTSTGLPSQSHSVTRGGVRPFSVWTVELNRVSFPFGPRLSSSKRRVLLRESVSSGQRLLFLGQVCFSL